MRKSLNDANREQKGIDAYGQALRSIFQKAADEGMEVIFLTPNLRTEKRDRNVGEKLIEDAWEVNAENERNGLHDILTWQGRYVRAGWCTNEYKGTGYIG